MVSENNVYFWAGRMLLEAARLRKRRHIEEQIDRVTAPFGRRPRGTA
jgi:trehalose 6-phosphate synthase